MKKLSIEKFLVWIIIVCVYLILFTNILKCNAQPSDFSHRIDTIYFLASEKNNSQVYSKQKSFLFAENIPTGQYKVGVYTQDRKSIERYARFYEHNIDSSIIESNDSIKFNPQIQNFLVLVKKIDSPKSPIISNGVGGQTFMYDGGNYWYCYLFRSLPNEKFLININQSSTIYIEVEPRPGEYYLYTPLNSVIIDIQPLKMTRRFVK